MTTMDPQAFGILQAMHAQAGIRPPDPAKYVITQPVAPPAPVVDQQQTAETSQGRQSQQTGWDVSAFDALPADQRAGVMAGVAVTIGRQALELAADKVLNVPSDVHHHLTSPEQYVDANGIVDTDAIATAVNDLALRRSDLAKPGAGRNTAEQRQAPAGIGGGVYSTAGQAAATEAVKVKDILAQMQVERG